MLGAVLARVASSGTLQRDPELVHNDVDSSRGLYRRTCGLYRAESLGHAQQFNGLQELSRGLCRTVQ